MVLSKKSSIHGLTLISIFLLFLLLMQSAFAWEHYEGAFPGKRFEIMFKRDKNDPRYALNDKDIKIENEKMIPFYKLGSDELGNDIFASGKVPPDSECYFTEIMMTVCWVPVGTEIIKRGYASEAFKSQTGVVMCSDSVAGRGPCMDLQRIPTSSKRRAQCDLRITSCMPGTGLARRAIMAPGAAMITGQAQASGVNRNKREEHERAGSDALRHSWPYAGSHAERNQGGLSGADRSLAPTLAYTGSTG